MFLKNKMYNMERLRQQENIGYNYSKLSPIQVIFNII